MQGTRIAAVSQAADARIAEARQLDCSGCTITAGFWNSHVHFFERQWADAAHMPREQLQKLLHETFTRFGFTTVFDTGSPWENTRAIRDRIESGEVSGPRIFSTGEALVPPGAMPPGEVLEQLGFMDFPAPEIASAQDAAQAAAALIASGVDAIKIFPSSPRSGAMPHDAIAAASRVAREAGKTVFAHPDTVDDVRAAMRNGVSILAHTTPQSPVWDDALISEMLERGVAVTPTLALWKTRGSHKAALEQLRAWNDAGGCILFGTDLGAVPADPAAEYELMREAGMSFAEILNALTAAPAARFAAGDKLGTVEEGRTADLTVFAGEMTNVRYVLRAGRLLEFFSGAS